MTLRVTRKTDRLLRILLAIRHMESKDGTFNMESRHIIEQCGMPGPRYYSVIARLEADGLVEGRIEVLPPGFHRPRRTYFHLTEKGAAWAAKTLNDRKRRFSLSRWIRKNP